MPVGRTKLATVKMVCLAAVTASQPMGAQVLAFEAASVKQNRSGTRISFGPGLRNGKLDGENVTLKALLQVAYNVQSPRISGPDWLDSDRFDVAAKASEDSPAGDLALMVQSLLKERFQVAVHWETREMSVYELVAAKGGMKIRAFDPADRPEKPHFKGGSSMRGTGTMEQIADQLAKVAGRPVVDRTGSEGKFSYVLEFAPLSAPTAESSTNSGPPEFFTAVQQQLGLRLESKKRPIAILLVDHAERVPSAN